MLTSIQAENALYLHHNHVFEAEVLRSSKLENACSELTAAYCYFSVVAVIIVTESNLLTVIDAQFISAARHRVEQNVSTSRSVRVLDKSSYTSEIKQQDTVSQRNLVTKRTQSTKKTELVKRHSKGTQLQVTQSVEGTQSQRGLSRGDPVAKRTSHKIRGLGVLPRRFPSGDFPR